jgi:hypothetical protein
MSEVRKLRFPGGFELRIPDGMDPDEFYRRHQYMSLVEGMCPIHQTRLEIAPGDSRCSPGSGLPWLTHDGCHDYWQIDVEQQTWTLEPWWSWAGYHRPPGWAV